jgi:hypothetical protein
MDLIHFNNPLSPPSDPVQRRLQSPPAKSNFLAVFDILKTDNRILKYVRLETLQRICGIDWREFAIGSPRLIFRRAVDCQ